MKPFIFHVDFKNIFDNNDTSLFFDFDPFMKTPEDLFGLQDEVYGNVRYFSFDYNEVKPHDDNKSNIMKIHEKEAVDVSTKVEIKRDQANSFKKNESEEKQTLVQHHIPKDMEDKLIEISKHSKEDSIDDNKSEDDSDDEVNSQDDQTQQHNLLKKARKYGTLCKIRETCPKRRREQGVKHTRWNREVDRKAFTYLSEILTQQNMDLQEFLFDGNIKIVDDFNQSVLCSLRLAILDKVCLKFSWLNTHYFLFKRLKRLALKQTFSFRETKLLRQVLNKQKLQRRYDLSVISILFPGKFNSSIRNECRRILNVSNCPF